MLIVGVSIGLAAGLASADIATSPNYKFINTDLGGGGLGSSSSPHYQSSLSVGDSAVGGSAVGGSSSPNYQFEAGSQTTSNPGLAFSIDNSTASFGSFSPSTTATATSSFSVADYTSYGYVVQIVGDPPSNGNHKIAAMGTTGSSQIGQEQFGINLVANTQPTNFGVDPDNGQFGAGSAASNYDTANHFRYVSGETVAMAPKSSGQTTYTISYIINVNSLTPGGKYTTNQSLICTGTF